MSGYLTLTAHEQDKIIVYRNDKNGNPILNPDDILIIKLIEICGGTGNKAKICFNGDNYEIVRYKALKESELKEIVDKKLKNLEEKLT